MSYYLELNLARSKKMSEHDRNNPSDLNISTNEEPRDGELEAFVQSQFWINEINHVLLTLEMLCNLFITFVCGLQQIL